MTKLEQNIINGLRKLVTDELRKEYAATNDKYLLALDHARYGLDMSLPMNSDRTDLIVETFENMLEGETQ